MLGLRFASYVAIFTGSLYVCDQVYVSYSFVVRVCAVICIVNISCIDRKPLYVTLIMLFSNIYQIGQSHLFSSIGLISMIEGNLFAVIIMFKLKCSWVSSTKDSQISNY